MSDEEVKVLIEKLSISKLEDRDPLEVAGYFEALDLISEVYPNMEVSERTIKNLQNLLMKHSLKDGGTAEIINSTAMQWKPPTRMVLSK